MLCGPTLPSLDSLTDHHVSDATLRIKNLFIALEALSHLSGTDVYRSEVEVLLAYAINEAKKETQWPHKAPAKPETQYNPFANNADDIPFQPFMKA